MKKIAIVTGGSKGIGKAVAKELEKNNYLVYKVSRKNCDITNKEAITNYIKQFKKVDVLVNCAGTSHLGTIENISEDDLWKTYNTNVLGTFRFCKAILPIMKKQKSGYIINLGSLRGIECSEGKASYSMSKFAVRAFSNTLGLEVRKYGIKVTCINPGFVYTDQIKFRIKEEKLKKEDIIQPEDIGKTIIYLLDLSEGVFLPELNLGEVWK